MEETTPLIAPPNSSPRSRRAQVQIYLAVISVLYMIPLVAANVVVYDLLFEVVCKYYSISQDVCLSEPIASESVANILSTVSLLNGIIATIVNAVLTALSDRIGRKFGLLWFMIFSTLGILAYPIVAYQIPANVTYWRMLIPYILTAASGSTTVALNLSVLHITDLMPDPTLRTKYLGWFIGTLMLCQAMAPGLGGAILKAFSLSTATYLTICTLWMVVGIIAAILLVHRSDSASDSDIHDNAKDHLKAFVIRSLDTVSFKSCEDRQKRRNALILLLNFFFSNEFAVGFIDLIMIYAKHKFHWIADNIGQTLFYLFSVRTAWALIGFPFMYGQLTKIWPAHATSVDQADLVHMFLSNILALAGFLILAFAKTSQQYTFGTIVIANDGIAGPVWLNAILKHVSEGQRGEFMAAFGLVIKPAGAILPAILMKIFQTTLNFMPNLVFFLVTAMALLVTISMLWLRPSSATHATATTPTPPFDR